MQGNHQRRVVVTGMGAVCPLGLQVPTLWQSIMEGRNGIGPITLFDASHFDTRFAGEVKGFDPANYMDKKEARRTDRFIHLTVAATHEALRTSELTITPENHEEVGVFFGSGTGGLETSTIQSNVLHTRGPSRISPFTVPSMISNMGAGQVAIMTGARGPNMCIVTACASGAHAIGEAAEVIRRGWAKAMIAGGGEASITPLSLAAFNSARAVSTRNDTPETASRPFDATRDGFVLSEGAAMLVLEDLEYALERGAPILAELVGYGASSDAFHMTQPPEDGRGAALAMRMALKHGGLSPDKIDYINAHGTSTPVGDLAETMAIKSVFGEHVTSKKLPVSSTKSQTGHLLGAAGSLECIITMLAIRNQMLPPTLNLHHPDPKCDLDYVPHDPRPARVDTAVCNSFGFGGHNASLIFRRFEGR
jgi:3-oxoacyl-[acyl-carrier-protein] synthase II